MNTSATSAKFLLRVIAVFGVFALAPAYLFAETSYLDFNGTLSDFPGSTTIGTDWADNVTGKPAIANNRLEYPGSGGWIAFDDLCGQSFTIEFTIENFDFLCSQIGLEQMFGFQIINSGCFFPLAIWNANGKKQISTGQGCSPADALDDMSIPSPLPTRATLRLVVDNDDYTASKSGVTTAYIAFDSEATTDQKRANRWTKIGEVPFGNEWNQAGTSAQLRIFSNTALSSVYIDNVIVEAETIDNNGSIAPPLDSNQAYLNFDATGTGSTLPNGIGIGTDAVNGVTGRPQISGERIEFPWSGGWLSFNKIFGGDFSVEFTIKNFEYLYSNLPSGQAFGFQIIDSAGFYPLAFWNNNGQNKIYIGSGFDTAHLHGSVDIPSPVPSNVTFRMEVIGTDDYAGAAGTTNLYVAFGSDATSPQSRGKNWKTVGVLPMPNWWNVQPGKLRIYSGCAVNKVIVDDVIVWGNNITQFGPQAPALASPVPVTARVEPHNGMPALFIDGKPLPALFHFSQEVPDLYAQKFTQAGFKFYTFIEYSHYLDIGWTGPYEFDFSMIDNVMYSIKHRIPDGYYLPRIHLWAPEWWMTMHPQERTGYLIPPADDTYVVGAGSNHESFQSELWKKEAGEGLRRAIRHMLSKPYSDRMIGVQLCNAAGGEWHPFAPENLPDNSSAMLIAFRGYLRQKYQNDVAQLRTAWNDAAVTFENATIPNQAERKNPDTGIFHNPALARKTLDYYEAYHDLTVETIDYFCRIVKEESAGRLLTCINYAYQPDMPYSPSEVDHRAGAKAHRLSSIDIFTSPHEYWQRDLGESGNLRTFAESLAVHGKLFIDEADERTHLQQTGDMFRHATNLWESLQVLRRSFAVAVTHGVGMWYMDHTSGNWYNDPEIFNDFSKYQRWANYSMLLPRDHQAQVALISSNKSEFYVASMTQLDAQFVEAQVDELSRAGAPFGRYYIEDLADGLVPEHKVYIFLDCFYLTDEERLTIEALKKNNHTLLWIYAPGFCSSSALSLASMSNLTNISFAQSSSSFDFVNVNTSMFPKSPSQYRAWQENFGDLTHLSPRFVCNDPAATTWGTYTNGEKALVKKSLSGWTSIYSPTARLPWAVLNRIYRDVGVHVYCEDGDNLSANGAWLSLHTVNAGKKSIQLPRSMPVYDVINEQLISSGTTQFSVNLAARQTALFMFANPEMLEEMVPVSLGSIQVD